MGMRNYCIGFIIFVKSFVGGGYLRNEIRGVKVVRGVRDSAETFSQRKLSQRGKSEAIEEILCITQ
jgi:hypothetical protein